MSKLEQKPLRTLRVPSGQGTSVWVYDDVATGEDTADRLSLTETIVPPRGATTTHVHERESESLYIRAGLGDDGEMAGIGPGGFVHFPQGGLHRFHNPTDRPSRILTTFAPAGFEQFSQETGEPRVDGGPRPEVTPEYSGRADQIGRRYGQIVQQGGERRS